MNKRIKELAAQCYKMPEEKSGPKYFDEVLFAELIIQQCCEMINRQHQYNNPHDCLLVLDIKEHFGVEE